MFNFFKLNLQLFGDGGGAGTGDGGEGSEGAANPGSNPQPSPEARLLELGVPADKIRKRQKQTLDAGSNAAPQLATADNAPSVSEESSPKLMSKDELLAVPEYNTMVQGIVNARLKSAKAAEERLNKLAPAIDLLAKKYGLDAENMDFDALNNAINDDDTYYEERALRTGEDIETAKANEQRDIAAARQQRIQEQSLQQQMIDNHIHSLEAQAEELKKTFPNFDLRKELENPVFVRLTAPNSGLSLADAHFAIHRNEIMSGYGAVTAQQTAQKLSKSIAANGRRPSEAGTTGQAPSVTTFDYRNASKEQREALKKRIRSGEKVYPGQW